MAHIGKKARFQLIGAAQMIRPFIDLGVKRDDPSVGIFELLVDPSEIFLTLPSFCQSAEQFLVLLSDLVERAFGPLASERRGNFGGTLGTDVRDPAWQQLLQDYIGAAHRASIDLALIDQPARADNTQAHAGM